MIVSPLLRPVAVLFVLSLVSIPGTAALSDEEDGPALTAAQQERFAERDRLAEQAQSFAAEGKLPEAIAAIEEAMAIERDILGDDHEDVIPNCIEG